MWTSWGPVWWSSATIRTTSWAPATPPIEPADIRERARFAIPFNHPTVLYRRDLVLAVGGYTDFARMEDYLLWAKLILAGARVANVAEPLVKYRVGAGAYTRRGGWEQLRAELAVQRRFRRLGFTSRQQYLRNVLVRGGYRLVPERIRRVGVSTPDRNLPSRDELRPAVARIRATSAASQVELVMTTPTAVPEPFSAEGAALIEAGYPLDAVDLLRQAVASGEPSGPDLLLRAYLDSGNWHAAAEWLTPLVAAGHVRFAGALGQVFLEIGDRDRAEEMLRLAVESGDAARRPTTWQSCSATRAGTPRRCTCWSRAADAGEPYAGSNLVELHLEAGNLPAAIEAAERYADERRPETLVALAEVRARQGHPDEAERLHRRAEQLGALRAHTSYGRFLQRGARGLGAARARVPEGRAARRARRGPTPSAGSCWTTAALAKPAATWSGPPTIGDNSAAEALIDLDGDPTDEL